MPRSTLPSGPRLTPRQPIRKAEIDPAQLGSYASIAVGCPQHGWTIGSAKGPQMPTVEQCRAYAAEHKILGANPRNAARRSTVLMNIPRSWTTLATQLEILATIANSEGK